MLPIARKLFRAHSKKYLKGPAGIILNPNLQRARTPRDMPPTIHRVVNEWFVDRFGVGYREQSLFCTGNPAIAAGYLSGLTSLITLEPIGDYSVCYSTKCGDLFGYCQFFWSNREVSDDKIRADLDSLDFIHKTNEGIEQAASSGNEVMLVAERMRYNVC